MYSLERQLLYFDSNQNWLKFVSVGLCVARSSVAMILIFCVLLSFVILNSTIHPFPKTQQCYLWGNTCLCIWLYSILHTKVESREKYQGRCVCQKQVWRAGTNNYTPKILWGVITCPCPSYLFLAQHVPQHRNSWHWHECREVKAWIKDRINIIVVYCDTSNSS